MTSDETEKRSSVDQKLDAVLGFLAEHAQTLCRQGAVVETWRTYRGRRVGPFYSLRYRRDGRQRSVYLGRDAALADEVRTRLRQMQSPLRERRATDKRWARERETLRKLKSEWDRELRKIGLRLKGYEVRGEC